MNDILYHHILVSYIPHIQRPILQQKDWWLLPIRRIQYDLSFSSLLTDILLHGGQPCNKRYCTCMYFSNTDKSYYYKSLCDFI